MSAGSAEPDEQGGPAPSYRDVDSATDEERAASVAALDVQAQFPAILRLHAWLLEELDPQPGMHALDVGCGTGDDVRGLAARVGTAGSATGVDPSGTMLEEARRRAEAARSPARFVQGSAQRLPVAAGSLDLVRCERVLQHLDDPAGAVREMRRALRPGGRLGLIDTDWRTLALWPGDNPLVDAGREAWIGMIPTPSAGAQLLDLVAGHGFLDARVTTETLLLRPRSLDQPPASLLLAEAARRTDASDADLAAWRTRLQESAARGAFLFAVTMYAVSATRP